MKRVTMVTVLVALASLAGAAPSAWAVEPASVAVAPDLDQGRPASAPAVGEVAESDPAVCMDPIVQALDGLALGCNYGAPPCFYGIQCDTYCGQAGTGICLSGCCACRF